MKGFEEVKKIPAIPFPDHSQGIISQLLSVPLRNQQRFPGAQAVPVPPQSATKSPGLGVLSPPAPQAPVQYQGTVLEGIPTFTTSISAQEVYFP